MISSLNEDDIRLAHRLADIAADVIRPFFRASFDIDVKADHSPVTRADRGAEQAMRALLEKERPEDGIFGEEMGVARPDAKRVWVLDPIDGTRAFIGGRASFGTLIALVEEGKPVLGIINQPIHKERWVGAKGYPTFFNGKAIQTRSCATLDQALLSTTAPWLFEKEGEARFDALRPHCRDTLLGGDCYNYGLLASGHGDLVVEQGLKFYDFAALVPIVEGAGGVMRDWQNRPLDKNSVGEVIAAGDPRLIQPTLSAMGL
ncbi:histidinol-phosphatase [Zymomonas mobilis]|uniref:Histidinol-phosphatase n=1 Tax=Zymomonas mobilis subsp. pomaceae (strain ATCC 29192 / DSM 22645 / JCM 10191 / CCUG 17912 / NBRC 13757 / NCIMB 11200 / NRRL B-4491 / Barker I) TaxID=579138 RepID=F8EW59_ZYMMT|nr:histidinol-phosphatase [Zymomonas mobilis]AEI38469.1 histidinol-phosphate phosphatase [Zymomonas mobilis subsp. pomaceae ATCC 29192]MDX5948158.1 histidinol-phosphatase [Zymomonas mobilis subsp. pomaceae]GEB89902.1 histidinol-phosphatase [Zymomonas mobilis subsp. pomaceae]